jgi:hypothetical protein
MKKDQLTPALIDQASIGEYRDGAGLHLLVTNASKTWIQRYTFAGKRTGITIGKYPAMSLFEARHVCQKARAAIKNGHAPVNKHVIVTLDQSDHDAENTIFSFSIPNELARGIKQYAQYLDVSENALIKIWLNDQLHQVGYEVQS